MSLDQQITEIFAHYNEKHFFNDFSVVVFFEDGQIISDLGGEKLEDSHSKVALMAGAWEASIALNGDGFFSEDQILSLADSKSGFLVLPMRTYKKLRVGIIYQDVINPGRLKMKAKLLRDFFSDNLTIEKNESQNISDGLLFENITDDELNELFAFAGI